LKIFPLVFGTAAVDRLISVASIFCNFAFNLC